MNEIHAALVEAYRSELRDRYRAENVHRFSELEGLDEQRIDVLREFFLDHVYPPFDLRERRDLALEDMGQVLRSPRKMWPLFGTAIHSVLRLGLNIGDAIKAGWRTLDAYLDSLKLEKLMLSIARDLELGPGHFRDQEAVITVVQRLPESRVVQFRKEILKLFDSLANVELLKSTLDILDESKAVMEKRMDLFTERELSGLSFGRRLLGAGYDLFKTLSDREVDLMLSGIEIVETDWYKRVMAEAVHSS